LSTALSMLSSRNGRLVTPTDLPFEEIWLHDFEFVSQPGERPDVVCLAAHELRSGRTLRLWRDELGEQPPYRTDDGVLFVNFVANAECACHLALDWPLPANVLDLSPAFRNLTNGRYTPEGKGLLGALRYFGLDTISTKHKDGMQKRVMRGWPFTPEEREQILKYCGSDVDALARLLPFLLNDSDLNIALYHGEFAAVSALMEHYGVPIDMEIFPQLADENTWGAVRDAMVPAIDAKYGVYVRGENGEWSFNMDRFDTYCARAGIAWPRLESGKLNMKRKTFEDMSKGRPQLEDLRQLRHTRDKMRKIKLAVGADGRNRTVLWPFKAKTSRTQPKASQWIFSPAVWLRSLIKPGPGMAVAYIDYSSMEFLIAAVLSDGHCGPVNAMLDMYKSGDPYLSFAKRVGAVPSSATKKSHAEVRDKYKVMLLATQYGMSAETLAGRLGVSSFEAHEMLNQHRELFAQYWKWSDDWVAHSLQTGVMRTAFGWEYHVGITEPTVNARSIRNWPVQATGADILRISCILAARHGIKILAPVHDAVLIEAPIERIEADVALMQEIMRRASRVVLNSDASGTHELRTDAKIIRYPDRYSDKRGEDIWAYVLKHLADYQRAANERIA
jgi:DNA polymerase family A